MPDLAPDSAEAEIRDLEIPIFVDEEVLGLEVAVEDPAGVAVSDGGDKLLEVAAAEIFREAGFGDLGEKLAALDEVHDEIDLRLGGEDLVELDDVGVVEPPHDGNLALDVGHQAARGGDLLLADNLDGHALPRAYISRVVDLGKGPASEEPPHLVLSEQGVVVVAVGNIFDLWHEIAMPEIEPRFDQK